MALFGDDSPADRLADYVDLDEYALLHQAARWARGEDVAADGTAGSAGSGRVSVAALEGFLGARISSTSRCTSPRCPGCPR